MQHCVLQVIIMDPTQEYTAELLSVAEMFYANNIPLRFVSPRMEFQSINIHLTIEFKMSLSRPDLEGQ